KMVTCEWQFSLPAIARRGGTQPPRIADSPIYSGPSPPGGFTFSLRYITMIFAQTFENNSCGLTVFWCGSIRLKVTIDPSSILCFAMSQPLACLSAHTRRHSEAGYKVSFVSHALHWVGLRHTSLLHYGSAAHAQSA